jgi:hypothetical protein
MQQRTGNRILDGCHADDCWVLANLAEHLFEGGTADKLYLLSLEIEVCGYVVERPCQSLYRNSFHLFNAFFDKKTPLSRCCEAEPDISFSYFCFKFTYGHPLHRLL